MLRQQWLGEGFLTRCLLTLKLISMEAIVEAEEVAKVVVADVVALPAKEMSLR